MARVRCLLSLRYRRHRRAAVLALRIYKRSGSVVGLEPARTMNGGWRGHLTLVPHLPTGRRRRHLLRLAAAFDDYHKLEVALRKRARAAGRRLKYHHRPLRLRFFRSVGRGTPSAYADGWTVAWNVNGSLLRTARGVRETLWHEVFHLNDAAHNDWSLSALGPLHAAIVKRCTRYPRSRRHLRGASRRRRHRRGASRHQRRGRVHSRPGSRSGPHTRAAPRPRARGRLSNRCLEPYAPHRTKVRGKTYYAFHPESGVAEYAAELAVRYYLEHRAVLAGRPPHRPFKCRRPENAKAWKRLGKEFFAGVDLVPPCSR